MAPLPSGASDMQERAPLSIARLDVALESPFRIAYDTITHAHNVLVTASADGETGYGEGAPQPAITGDDQATVMADLSDGSRRPPRTTAGRAAVDCAQLDLAARQADRPLCQHLGGGPPRPVQTSITIPLVPTQEIAGLVRRRLDEGFSVFKVKAGLDVAEDLERLRVVRDAIGDAEMRVDANQGWNLTDAMAALGPLGDLDVSFLEQPLAKDDLDGHAALRTASRDVGGPPIMLDESVFSAADARAAMEAEACDLINIKLQKCGGTTAGLAIADTAASAGIQCMVGCMLETRIGMLHAAHLVLAHDNIRMADIDGAWLLADDPVQGGGRYDAGALHVDGSPGIGVAGVA